MTPRHDSRRHARRKTLARAAAVSQRTRTAAAVTGEEQPLTTPTIERPALRYYGGKWRIGEWIIDQFPPHECYVEPFCGAASVFFQKHRSRIEVLNDLNRDVVNFFEIIRNRPAELVRLIELTPYSRLEYQQAKEPTTDSLERARRFFVRCWQGYGPRSGWRFQYQRTHSSSNLAEDWADTDRLHAVAERLRGVFIECDDALSTIKRYDGPRTLFYCDPPYVHDTRVELDGYAHEMSDEQHRELATALNSVKGMVILSGYESPLYADLYAGWRCVKKDVHTNGKAGAVECLWLSPNATALSALPLFASAPADSADEAA